MPLAELLQWILRGALAVVFLFMGVAHFLPRSGRTMAAMIPASLKRPGWPSAKTLVRFTGVCEIAGAIGLLVPATHFAAGIALVIFLVAVFPANAVAAGNPEKFGSASIPFWPRYLGQVALVAACALAAV